MDGPTTGVRRSALNFKSLLLTDFKINISVSARTTQVKKAMEDAEIEKKWSETKWAKGLASRQKRASLTDFERFVVRVNKTKVWRDWEGNRSPSTPTAALLPTRKRRLSEKRSRT